MVLLNYYAPGNLSIGDISPTPLSLEGQGMRGVSRNGPGQALAYALIGA